MNFQLNLLRKLFVMPRAEDIFVKFFIVCKVVIRAAAAGAEHTYGAVGAFAGEHFRFEFTVIRKRVFVVPYILKRALS